MIFTFGECILDTDSHVLTRDGEVISVEPQVFDLLCLLAENAGNLVAKDQLIDSVWQGRIVSEATISARINAARKAVGDNGKDQAIIRTIPRRGFKLVAPLEGIAAPTGEARDPAAKAVRQTIRYTMAPDGTNLAWASAGSGAPVLFGMHHLSHLERDWASDLLKSGFEKLAQSHTLIRYDVRGAGLSDPIRDNDTIDQHVADMIAVADAAGLERFPVVGILQNAAVAIRVAATYPERVSRLVIQNGYARGRARRAEAPAEPEHDPFIALLNSGGWGDAGNGFMRGWATMVMPEMTPDEITELIHLIANCGATADALAQRNVIDQLDVTADLSHVTCPTLVIHARGCTIHPVSEGRRLAAGIAGAEFLEADSSNSFYVTGDPAHKQVVDATLEFLSRE